MFCSNISNGGATNFLSLITQGFGYSTFRTILVQMPASAVILAAVLLSTYGATKLPNARCYIIAVDMLVSTLACGLLIGLPHSETSAMLAGIYLWGIYSASLPISLSLISSNVSGFTKKATCSALVFTFYCAANIISPQFYFSWQAPIYRSGLISSIVCSAAAAVIIILYRIYLSRENKRRDREYGIATAACAHVASHPNGEKQITRLEITDVTDRENMNFRYKL